MGYSHKYFYWYYNRGKNKLLFSLGISFFFWFFLGTAQPFGISSDNLSGFFLLMLWLLLPSISWLLSILAIDFMVEKISKKLNKRNYKLDVLFWGIKIFLVVHFVYLIRNIYCDWNCFDSLEYMQLWFCCILIFILFYIPFSFYSRYKYYKSLVGENKELATNVGVLGHGKQKLEIDLNSIIFLKSDDNYVDVFYVSPNYESIKKDVLRTTLKSVESQCQNAPQFIRVHRSYIINLQFLKRESYNHSKNFMLLTAVDREWKIPISRTYFQKIKKVIA